jgi:arylsulfatase A-like enzyme
MRMGWIRDAGRWFGGTAAAVLVALACAGAAAPAANADPNILLILTDDQRDGETMKVMPDTRRAFFRGGVKFSNAVVTTPLCCPSRVSILSGQYAHNHGVFHNSSNQAELAQIDHANNLPNLLQNAGYRTGMVGKYLNGWDFNQPPPDFDEYAMQSGNFFNTTWSINGQQQQVSKYATGFTGDQARAFIKRQEADDEQPWFLWVNPFAPHSSFGDGPPRFEPAKRYRKARVGKLPGNPARDEDTPAEVADKPPFWRDAVEAFPAGTPGLPTGAESRKGQLRMLMSVDDMIAAIDKTLKKTGERRETLAIFTSDNGLFWGEHGEIPIKDMPYLPAIEVPFGVRWPGNLPAGQNDPRLVANIDIAPTILDAIGNVPATMDGRSVLAPAARENILVEYGGFDSPGFTIPKWAGLYKPGAYQYTQYYAGNGAIDFREYYDLVNDPFELENPFGNANPGDDPNVAALDAAIPAARLCAGVACP